MNIAVIGTGYVGLVVGACLADLGNNVVCVDKDKGKISTLKNGESPIFEPGLDKLLHKNIQAKRISFSTDTPKAVKESELVFIAVGTPMQGNGEPELKYVKQASEEIGKAMNSEKIIVNKSTVPVGTGGMVEKTIKKHFNGKFHIASNPEFLREGSAVSDFLNPDRIVIGCKTKKARQKMKELYSPLNAKILFTDIESAELIKYGSNAFLATKISFINELSRLCDRVGADVKKVAEGIGLDKRIGPHFLNAGCGWGGSCFPKDVRALVHMGKEYGVDLKIPRAAEQVNKEQKILAVKKLREEMSELNGKKIALLGLSFKPNTDDMREASSIEIANALTKQGATVIGYDPVALKEAKKNLSNIEFADSPYKALDGAHGMVLVTEWDEFKRIDFNRVKKIMKNPLVVDGRNIYQRKELKKLGFQYKGIGQ